MKKFQTDKNDYLQLVNNYKLKIQQIDTDAEQMESKVAIVRKYLDCDTLTFEMVQLFVDRIVVHEKEPYSKEINIEIYWNF